MSVNKYLYLMVKTHTITGLKYLCKKVTTSDSKAISYLGSGTRWNNHLKVHGKHINTEIIVKCELDKIEEFSKLCIEHSNKFNIVKSDEWANLIEENGLMGAVCGKNNQMYKKSTIDKLKKTINSPIHKQKMIKNAIEINSRPDVREKIRQSKLGDKNPSKRPEVIQKIKDHFRKPEVLEYYKKINSGEKNPNADLSIYSLKNIKTGIILIGTKHYISNQSVILNKLNNNLSILILSNITNFNRKNRKTKTVKGWIKL